MPITQKPHHALFVSDDEEALDFTDAALFDITDITFDVQRTKNGSKVYLILKSKTPINLMRFYLAVKSYIYNIEQELGIMEESPDVQ